MFKDILSKELSIGEVFSILTISLILLGFFNLYSYYSLFGIDITTYLEPTEIIFSFSSMYITLLYYSIVFIAHELLMAVRDLFNNEVISKQSSRKAKLILLIITTILIVIVTAFYFLFVAEYIWYQLDGSYVVFFLLLALVLVFPTNSKYKYGATIILCIGFLQLKNVSDFDEITKNHNPKYLLQFEINNTKIGSGPDFYFIGATKNHLFFWDNCNMSSISYRTENIGWISTKDNRDSTYYKIKYLNGN